MNNNLGVSVYRTAVMLCVLVLFGAGTMYVHAQRVWDWPVIGAPTVSYSPETKWSFGVSAAGYIVLPADSLKRTSELTIDAAYTLNKQWFVTLGGTLYITPEWQFSFRIGYRNFPDCFYGVGNRPSDMPTDPLRYTSAALTAYMQPLYNVGNGWHVGPVAQGRLETKGLAVDSTGATKQWGEVSAGAVAMYDGRDNIFYPHRGLFFKAQLRWLGLTVRGEHFRSVAAMQLDFRHFLPIYGDFIFAYQVYANILAASSPISASASASSGFAPTAVLLPAVGGQDVLRGFYTGQFRDEAVAALQAELRFPIYSILRGTAFAGIGDAYNLHQPRWAVPKVGYGVGLRLQFNTAGINIRADVARNNYDNRWNTISAYSFYLTVKEAF
ncbi:MAG: BamA/TamA family outer membrane protein [Paludibacteraceae bacterium]|nr:BamA/TamA family outer membrane protein [Paludibacteraceae bacterium]